MRVLYKDNSRSVEHKFYENDLTHIARCVKAYGPVDRTGHLNEFKKSYQEIPETFSDAKTWEECCFTRAEEIWSLGKPITLFWSGGIDSTCAFLALRHTMSTDDELNIRYTQHSIDEYPGLLNDIQKFTRNPIDKSQFFDADILEKDHVFVTGECGDQCFGSDVLEVRGDALNENWETALGWDNIWAKEFERGTGHPNMDERNKLWELLETHVLRSPVEVKTVFDLLWWINFSVKWEWVDKRIFLHFFRYPDLSKNCSFFHTIDFQKWSITNHDIKHNNTWLTYKQPAKDWIYSMTKDAEYQKNKTKERSIIQLYSGGSYDEKYTEQKLGAALIKVKLILDDGRHWLFGETVPDEVLKQIRI